MESTLLAFEDIQEQYLRETEQLRLTYERTGDGTATIRRRTTMVDRIVTELWQRATGREPLNGVCLLALGGYGRKDLFPFSDVDLLFAFFLPVE